MPALSRYQSVDVDVLGSDCSGLARITTADKCSEDTGTLLGAVPFKAVSPGLLGSVQVLLQNSQECGAQRGYGAGPRYARGFCRTCAS